jgi:hypothetical protein
LPHGRLAARENASIDGQPGRNPTMDLRLQLLESFSATGSDGATYKVCAYDRLAPDLSLPPGEQRWESTGEVEYRLADGRRVELQRDGTSFIAGSQVQLTLPKQAAVRA